MLLERRIHQKLVDVAPQGTHRGRVLVHVSYLPQLLVQILLGFLQLLVVSTQLEQVMPHHQLFVRPPPQCARYVDEAVAEEQNEEQETPRVAECNRNARNVLQHVSIEARERMCE